jgi:hypothetical protein
VLALVFERFVPGFLFLGFSWAFYSCSRRFVCVGSLGPGGRPTVAYTGCGSRVVGLSILKVFRAGVLGGCLCWEIF